MYSVLIPLAIIGIPVEVLAGLFSIIARGYEETDRCEPRAYGYPGLLFICQSLRHMVPTLAELDLFAITRIRTVGLSEDLDGDDNGIVILW